MTAPIDLEILKDDLGIDDDYSDDWLQRRVNGIWDRMESYTNRILRAPPATFRDEWPAVGVSNLYVPSYPPRIDAPSPYLRQFPVTEILSYTVGETENDETLVVFDKKSGKILSLDGTPGLDAGAALYGSGTVITYKAGWEELPAELYEIVLAIMTPLWTAKQASVPGALGPLTSVNINDVGSLDFGSPKTTGQSDPVLGPHSTILDRYVLYPIAGGTAPSSELVDDES